MLLHAEETLLVLRRDRPLGLGRLLEVPFPLVVFECHIWKSGRWHPVAQPFRAAPAAVGRPKGLRYLRPPAFLKRLSEIRNSSTGRDSRDNEFQIPNSKFLI